LSAIIIVVGIVIGIPALVYSQWVLSRCVTVARHGEELERIKKRIADDDHGNKQKIRELQHEIDLLKAKIDDNKQ